MEKINPLILKGIEDGQEAFIGPKIVQIDLTGRCNNDCLGCWVHSPLVKNPPRDKNLTLPFKEVKKLIEDLSRLGTEEIFLSGAGEPFLHPEILEIIELIKGEGFKLNIITNFILIDEKKAKKFIDLGVDMLTASIWAASPETYSKGHPSKTGKDFYKIKDNLNKLSQLKIEENKYLPHIKIYNVICNLNYNEIQQMIDFALDVQAEFIEFQIMDIIKDETSFLALLNEQIKDLKGKLGALTKRSDLYFKELASGGFNIPSEAELREFPGRFMRIRPDFSLKEWVGDKDKAGKAAWHLLTCPEGFVTSSSSKNPLIDEINNKITFKFLRDKCGECAQFKNLCPVDQNRKITFNFLRILNFGSFMRRINSADIYSYIYDSDKIDNIPCYTGWTYSRILSTGEVIPCCKATNKVVGNIYKNTFSEIWNSSIYQEFRYKAKFLSKNNPYFKEINCYKSCDNLSMNFRIKESISFNEEQKDSNCQIFTEKRAERQAVLPEAKIKLITSAQRFKSGNLNIQRDEFGQGIVTDNGKSFGFAEYKIHFEEDGAYELWSRYATDELRPVKLYFDGRLITKQALKFITTGWTIEDLFWFKEATFDICRGWHVLKIYRKGCIPHIYSFAFLKGVKDNKKESNRCLSPEIIYNQPAALKLFKDKAKNSGFVASSLKLLNYIKSGRFIDSYLDILGVFNGRYAFKGPFHVQIDLTNNCNNNCIGCWCNSPLLEEMMLSPKIKSQSLPFGLIREFLDEISQMGTKEIYFSGGGEPFMHPEIMEILTYAKKKNLNCYVNTNFTLLNEEKIRKLIDFGVDHLTVSTWAATPETYVMTHPNKSGETFNQIRQNLIFLNKIKKQTPYVKLYNVIFNLNYHELKSMVRFAKETSSESVEFTLIDTVPGKTDKLLLDSSQIAELQDEAKEIANNLNRQKYLDGVLLFRFDSFLRRIYSSSDLSKATYDRRIIDKIPCYTGWCFSRIMPNGDVNACLKAHRIPVGNLYQENFRQTWNGKRQQYFRRKTLVYEKKDPFFRLIGNDPKIKEAGCYKSCDDIGRNIYMHNRIMSLTSIERNLFKVVSKIKRKPNLTFDLQIRSKNPIISGIINGKKPFVGPEQVVIDITNRCNERCIGCWLYSPLLKKRLDSQWFEQEINFTKAKSLIDELADLGTKRIRFTGGGEPMMHPEIMKLIEYVKNKGLICCLTTNFSLINKDKVRNLIKLKIDELAISLWASNEKTYQKTHFKTYPAIFRKIQENLRFLTDFKKDKPFVTLCNVICNLNYREIEEMFKFALDMKVDGIYFTPVDTIKGATSCLLLDEMQKQEVFRQVEMIKEIQHELPPEKKIKLDYLGGFSSRLQQEGSSVGNYDQQRVNQIPCYVGWMFARVLADGSIVPCCRGVKKLMGNINMESFKDIWFSTKYNEFRAKAKYLSKNDVYFKEIECVKECDNLMHNEAMHKRIVG